MVNSGPIPGANYTSDTKNYPWHQPPEHTDISDALDVIVEKITDPKKTRIFTGMAEMGIPLYKLGGIIVMEGVSEGKWTVDMALLLVGPVTKILEILCNQMNVEYTVGIEDKPETLPGGMFFKIEKERKAGNRKIQNSINPEIEQVKADAQEQEQPDTGEEEPLGFSAMNKPQEVPPEEGMM